MSRSWRKWSVYFAESDCSLVKLSSELYALFFTNSI